MQPYDIITFVTFIIGLATGIFISFMYMDGKEDIKKLKEKEKPVAFDERDIYHIKTK